MRSFPRCMLVTPEHLGFVEAGIATGFVLLYGLPRTFSAARVASCFFAAALVTEER